MTATRAGFGGDVAIDPARARSDRLRTDQAAHDEETVRRGFWPKLKRVLARVPFAEELLAAYYCAFDRGTPHHVRVALLGALAYFVMPADMLPDLVPALGFTDDAAVLAGVLKLVVAHLGPQHRDAARHALDEMAR
ncbi:YkvA family protein [Rhodoplanes azumiensis]|uniref:YkvA family protein n=1 Tax=Rhodoplanes azumiensis TaxID=1897628 RepID=A0ABW5ALD6_9BRAD